MAVRRYAVYSSYLIGLITGNEEKLKLKFGVHSGPVLGGIIGSSP